MPDIFVGWTLRPHIQVWRMQTGIITPAWHCIALHLMYATSAHPDQTVAPSQPSLNHVVLPYQVIKSHGLPLAWIAAALISYQYSPTLLSLQRTVTTNSSFWSVRCQRLIVYRACRSIVCQPELSRKRKYGAPISQRLEGLWRPKVTREEQ